MSVQPKSRMSVEEFLAWAEHRPERFELFDGEVFAMAPQRVRHAETKFAVQFALRAGLRDAGLPCHMLPDGVTVRVDDATSFEPDALVYCGPRLDADATVAPTPVIVVEVLSSSTGRIDTGQKLAGYFRIPSVMHYLIIDPVKRMVIHHKRGAETLIETRITAAGPIDLTPPGFRLDVAACFAES
ncbi:Uma2 family endonuclease [Methylobacterium sp. J-068]|uniref:Uma2 family endonuclease n=1 Tax=Methylobacterium sp. J-068 TaxID=2836649 RepID=UPI001FBA59F2|nr:Uma2 family endonuclease [Methylobacterium sp. J-068]MCJ2034396.1 Uma2 family endonuclease [Methylobacterium sp. J-068]